MFGSIGITELILIAGVALMVLGPDKFPEFAKLAMRSMRDIRKYVADAQVEIAKELDPVKKKLDDASKFNPEEYLDELVGDDEEDDGTINPEPELSDDDLQTATHDISEDWDGAIEMEDSMQEHVQPGEHEPDNGGGASGEEAVEYNPFGAESEGADPYGIRANIAEESDSDPGLAKSSELESIDEDESERLDG